MFHHISPQAFFPPFSFHFCIFFSVCSLNTVTGSSAPSPEELYDKYKLELFFSVDLQLTNVSFIRNMGCWVVYVHQSNSHVSSFQRSEEQSNLSPCNNTPDVRGGIWNLLVDGFLIKFNPIQSRRREQRTSVNSILPGNEDACLSHTTHAAKHSSSSWNRGHADPGAKRCAGHRSCP